MEVSLDANFDLLVVENDPTILELLVMFLRRRGFTVRAAADFGEARRALVERLPDLMISDLMVGRTSAEAEFGALAHQALLPPTLVVSGFLDSAVEARLLERAEILGTLAKPFRLDELERRISAFLERGRASS